jgi:DNA polymerase-4
MPFDISSRVGINSETPQIMHIDLNSCFATVEQQARPLLRGRPIGVTNRITKYCCIIAASYEAKSLGIKVGMRLDEAKLLVPDIIMLESDPPKYHYAYQKLVNIMQSYSPNVTMKSIDEGVIDFHSTRENINKTSLVSIGYEIKQRLKDEVGCWMKCNVGIAPNRFLAKQAAGLHKPDGLDVIDSTNLRRTLDQLKLTDLTGIADKNQARLNAHGIFSPIQFLDADPQLLKRHVFKSVCGEDWHRRLRGHEVDDNNWATKSIGRQYVIEDRHPSPELVMSRMAYLCETTGMKLRYKSMCAKGIMVYVKYESGDYWYERKMFKSTFFTNAEVYRRAILLLNKRPMDHYAKEIGVSCYGLEPSDKAQLSLLEEVNREIWLTEAVDTINQQYGEFTITYANSLSSKEIVKQKIPFGSTRYFELLCKRA